jgi:hypothetical protein
MTSLRIENRLRSPKKEIRVTEIDPIKEKVAATSLATIKEKIKAETEGNQINPVHSVKYGYFSLSLPSHPAFSSWRRVTFFCAE